MGKSVPVPATGGPIPRAMNMMDRVIVYGVLILLGLLETLAGIPKDRDEADTMQVPKVGCKQGDMLLTKEQCDEFEQLVPVAESRYHDVSPGRGRDSGRPWSDATVPYVLTSKLYKTKIKKAMAEITKKTLGCIQFVEKNPANYYYIKINTGGDTGCSSNLGRMSWPGQEVNIGRGCSSNGIIEHELLHALGLVHEQSRTDRDDYVTINTDNLLKANEKLKHNFDKEKVAHEMEAHIPYDYQSLMHYGKHDFGSEAYWAEHVVEPKQKGAVIGQRRTLAGTDVLKLLNIYKNVGRCGDKIHPGESWICMMTIMPSGICSVLKVGHRANTHL